MRSAADDQALLLVAAARPGGKAFGDHARGQLVELGAALLDLPLDAGARFGEREPADPRIDVVGRLVERGERQALRERDDAVLDVAVLAHQHRERPARRRD